MFQLLVKFIFYIITKISTLIFAPIQLAIVGAFPSVGTLIDNIKYFLGHWVFDTLKWFKMFAINTLAFPQELLAFLVSSFLIIISVHATMIIYKGALTLYQKLKP